MEKTTSPLDAASPWLNRIFQQLHLKATIFLDSVYFPLDTPRKEGAVVGFVTVFPCLAHGNGSTTAY